MKRLNIIAGILYLLLPLGSALAEGEAITRASQVFSRAGAVGAPFGEVAATPGISAGISNDGSAGGRTPGAEPWQEWAIEPKYSQARPFSDGLSCVTVRGKKGFINTRGEMVIEPHFDRETSFRNGFAIVEYESKQAVIDKSGRAIWEARSWPNERFLASRGATPEGPVPVRIFQPWATLGLAATERRSSVKFETPYVVSYRVNGLVGAALS
jgi:hypothetical protein